MKEVLSLFTFGIGALFFVVFFATLKPGVVIAESGPNTPGYCNAEASPAHACRPHVVAAASRTRFGQR